MTIMITERYVSFEVARLLKLKGFNEDYPKGDCTQYGCTQQMACDWIEEKHKIHIVVRFVNGKGYVGSICDISNSDNVLYMVDTKCYPSIKPVYNEALKCILTTMI